MDTNNKEEIIEELDDVETSTPLQDDEIMSDKKIEEEIKVDIIQDAISTIPEDSPAIEENNGEGKSKKSKTPLLVLLFILLIIDVAALVVYIIGIDKVLGFIK